MGPTGIGSGLPTASSWFMNPYFMATFGIIAALGLVIFGITYFAFYVKQRKALVQPDERCSTCGLTGDMITRLIPCKDHSGLEARVRAAERWQGQHDQDYRSLTNRVNELERGQKR